MYDHNEPYDRAQCAKKQTLPLTKVIQSISLHSVVGSVRELTLAFILQTSANVQ